MASWLWVIVAVSVALVAYRVVRSLVRKNGPKPCFTSHLCEVAVSIGVGPFVGPVLAAQFGYAPSLAWIIIGMALGGIVQDVIIATLAPLRAATPRSLPQMARDYIGPFGGTLMLVLMIAGGIILTAAFLATSAATLGARSIVFAPGTTFTAPEAATITAVNRYDNVLVYRVPAGAHIQHTNGAIAYVPVTFDLHARPLGSPISVPLDVREPGKLPGSKIAVADNVVATRRVSGNAWATLAALLALPIMLLAAVIMLKVKKGGGAIASAIALLLMIGALYGAAAVNDPESWVNYYATNLDLPQSTLTLILAAVALLSAVLPTWAFAKGRDVTAGIVLLVATIGAIAFACANLALGEPLRPHYFSGGPIVDGGLMPFLFIVIAGGAIGGFSAFATGGEHNERPAAGFGSAVAGVLAVAITLLVAAVSMPTLITLNSDVRLTARIDAATTDQSGPTIIAKATQLLEAPLDGTRGGGQTVGLAATGAAPTVKGQKFIYHAALLCLVIAALAMIDGAMRATREAIQAHLGHKQILGIIGVAVAIAVATGLALTLDLAVLWPLFGVSSLLLAASVLVLATVGLIKEGRGKLLWATLLPLFITATTGVAGAVVLLTRESIHTAPLSRLLIAGLSLLALTFGVLCFTALRRKA